MFPDYLGTHGDPLKHDPVFIQWYQFFIQYDQNVIHEMQP